MTDTPTTKDIHAAAQRLIDKHEWCYLRCRRCTDIVNGWKTQAANRSCNCIPLMPEDVLEADASGWPKCAQLRALLSDKCGGIEKLEHSGRWSAWPHEDEESVFDCYGATAPIAMVLAFDAFDAAEKAALEDSDG